MELFTLQNLGSLVVLIFLQAVLGFDNPLSVSLESLSKATFYFAIFVLVTVDVIQSRYQDKSALERAHSQRPIQGV